MQIIQNQTLVRVSRDSFCASCTITERNLSVYITCYGNYTQLIFDEKNDKILKNMNFRGVFVNNIQKKKSTDAQIRATKKYSNSKWRPNVYLDMDKRERIENHFRSKGHKSFNEYVIALINDDMNKLN